MNIHKKTQAVLLVYGSTVLFMFALLTQKPTFVLLLIPLSMVGMSIGQYQVLKNTTSILSLELDTVYIYYGTTENGHLFLSKKEETGEYTDGVYAGKNIEWFEDPILGASYIYSKSHGANYLFLHTEHDTEETYSS